MVPSSGAQHVLGQIIENYLGLDASSIIWGLTNAYLVELCRHNETMCEKLLARYWLHEGYLRNSSNYEILSEEDSCSLGKCAFSPAYFIFRSRDFSSS